MDKYWWLIFVALAGLAWGTYVPFIFYGGNQLGGDRGARLMAILCVGVAYFVLAVLVPLILFFSGTKWPELTTNGVIFSSLAGVAGAVGAICVIFATQSAVGAAKGAGLPPASYKIYIAPLIFGLAPVINTLVSSFWHPEKVPSFHFESPGWKLWLGIVLVGLGAALVLFSKEEAESQPTKPKETHLSAPAAVASTSPSPTSRGIQENKP
jgi:drug/metabolite transporter (DMT)-like permease